MIRIPVCEPVLGAREEELVLEALRSGFVSSKGKFVGEFERGFSGYIGTRHGVATSNGTTALHLALAALGIAQGDEVLIPTFTMIATANAVHYTGARPVLLESDRRSWNLDPSTMAKQVTPRTKAIIVVHTYGHPVDMDPVLEIARAHDLKVIEDAAEAHGAEYRGRKVGTLGDVACFSFYANKIITTGEGGMLLTDSDELAEKARLLKDQAFNSKRRFLHEAVGFNYRLTNLQAALGVAQLERIGEFVRARRENARIYNSILGDLPGVGTPPEEPWAKNVYWMYSIRTDPTLRDPLARALLEKHGIETRPFFVPVHQQPAYAREFPGVAFPIAEELSRTGLNLPSGNGLQAGTIEEICSAIRSEYRNLRPGPADA